MESAAEKNIISKTIEIIRDAPKRDQLRIIFDANGFVLLLFTSKSPLSSGINKILFSKISTPIVY